MTFKIDVTDKYYPDPELIAFLGWPTDGHGHMIHLGDDERITRDFATLEELRDFTLVVGRCVIYDDEIEIYNNYRE